MVRKHPLFICISLLVVLLLLGSCDADTSAEDTLETTTDNLAEEEQEFDDAEYNYYFGWVLYEEGDYYNQFHDNGEYFENTKDRTTLLFLTLREEVLVEGYPTLLTPVAISGYYMYDNAREGGYHVCDGSFQEYVLQTETMRTTGSAILHLDGSATGAIDQQNDRHYLAIPFEIPADMVRQYYGYRCVEEVGEDEEVTIVPTYTADDPIIYESSYRTTFFLGSGEEKECTIDYEDDILLHPDDCEPSRTSDGVIAGDFFDAAEIPHGEGGYDQDTRWRSVKWHFTTGGLDESLTELDISTSGFIGYSEEGEPSIDEEFLSWYEEEFGAEAAAALVDALG